MTAPATRQTGRPGVDTVAAPIFVIDDAGLDRDLAARRRQTAGVNETRNPTRAVTHFGVSRQRGMTRGATGSGVGGAGSGLTPLTPAEMATMARVEEMKAKKDEDVKELYLADEKLEETPTIIDKYVQ